MMEPENADLAPSPSSVTAGDAPAWGRPDLASRDRMEKRVVDDEAVRRVFAALRLETPEQRAMLLFDPLIWMSVTQEQLEEPAEMRLTDSSQVSLKR